MFEFFEGKRKKAANIWNSLFDVLTGTGVKYE